ncbi:MAG: site-2 protease family protein [Methanolobus sp.]|uniref:site-2 protease family protein n=1 Tax=Methanolobus sp. TaxID=1874737 RepID=UPI00272F3DEF|nr:site-2 protease family protein [Methanolobus sp.]MDP2216080.1 site-2 protease family protein [Methanolobus sp.]
MNTTIAFTVFLLYWLFVIALKKKGILEKYNISTYGPVLMIRTTRGLSLLDKLAKPKKAWRLFADIGIRLMFIGMIAMFLIVILSDIALLSSIGTNSVPEPSKFNEARNIFLIPGVNEFIPLTWGIIALIVTLVVHEFSHAILCRVENIRVKSMGILLALVPIGGFAEPDEKELFGKEEEEEDNRPDPYGDRRLGINIHDDEPVKKKVVPGRMATRTQRGRILAAGVMANFVVTLIAFSLLFGPVLGAISPIGNTMIVDVEEDSAAYTAGLRQGMVITQLDETSISNVNEMLLYLGSAQAGSTVMVHAATDRVVSVYETQVIDIEPDNRGVQVQGVVGGSPAQAAGFEEGMYIKSMDGQPILTATDFMSFMDTTTSGQTVVVEIISVEDNIQETTREFTVQLEAHPDENVEKGFLGVYTGGAGYVETSLGFSVGEFPAREYLGLLKDIPGMLTGPVGWIILLGLPIIGFAGEGFPGFSGTLAQFYEPVGWAEPLGIGLFWIANALLWIGWLNFYVGLFNCLPAVPLDGGHIFRDYLHAALYRITNNELKAERLSTAITATFALLILMSFLLMIFGPYMIHGF